jgi:hypothetical protein
MSMFDKKPGQTAGGLFGAKPGQGSFLAATSQDDEDDAAYEGLPPQERAERVLTEAEEAFKARAKAEAERFELATDSEYWLAIGFQSRRQKEQFLRALAEKFRLADDGDKYLDGWEVAKALGIPLEREAVPYNTSEGKVDRKWLSLAR